MALVIGTQRHAGRSLRTSSDWTVTMNWTGQQWTSRLVRTVADVTGGRRADIVGLGDDDVWVAVSNGDGMFQQPVCSTARRPTESYGSGCPQ